MTRPSTSTFTVLSKRILHSKPIPSSSNFPLSISPFCTSRKFHTSFYYRNSDASKNDQSNRSINNEETGESPEEQKTPEQLKREEVLARLRTKKLMTPHSEQDAILEKRRSLFEQRHFGGTQENIVEDRQGEQDAAADVSADAHGEPQDPYAFVQTLTPAKYLSAPDGRHYWKAYYLYQDDIDPTVTELVEVEIGMRDASLIKSKYGIEDLNLALHLFLDAHPTPPQGAHIPVNKEGELKLALQRQIFVEPEPTRFQKFVSLVKDREVRGFVIRNAWYIFCIFWVTLTIFQATKKALEKRRLIKIQRAEQEKERQAKDLADLERARQRRLAAGLPMYDEEFEKIVEKAAA